MGGQLVLVTGGAGFIGSAVARAALAQGATVRVLDSLVTGHRGNVPEGAEFLLGDLRDPEALRTACAGVDVVYHQAALRSVARSVDEPLPTEETNVLGTLHLLQAAEAAGVRRVVYASSSSAYGETSAGVNREEAHPRPMSPYAVSKLAAEYYCRVWTRLNGLSTVSLRYFNVFGPGQRSDSRYAAVFPALISALVAGHAPEVHWDGEQSRDFTYIDDVVAANLAAAAAGPQADGAVCNIGAGRAKTVNETLAAVSEVLGVWIEPRRLPMRPGDVRATLASITRAKELLGWEPRADWREAVAATVAWFTTAGRGR